MAVTFKSVLAPKGINLDYIDIAGTKEFYEIGDTLDELVVTAHADLMTAEVTNSCTITPQTFDTLGYQTVTVDYNVKSDSFDVKVCNPGDFELTSWEDIQAIGAAGNGANYWSVGDTKTITINGDIGILSLNNYQCKVYIIDFNYRGDNGIYFQGFTTADDIEKSIALYSTHEITGFTNGIKNFSMNHWYTSGARPYNYGGWKGCDLRYDILGSTNVAPSGYGSAVTSGRVGYDATETCATNPVPNTLMAALPSDLRSVLAPWTIYTDNSSTNSHSTADTVTTSIDYLPLLAEYEIFGSRKYANSYEYTDGKQEQFTFYKNGGAKKKYYHDNLSESCHWWERSPKYYGTDDFCLVKSDASSGSGYIYYYGLAPAFRVA